MSGLDNSQPVTDEESKAEGDLRGGRRSAAPEAEALGKEVVEHAKDHQRRE